MNKKKLLDQLKSIDDSLSDFYWASNTSGRDAYLADAIVTLGKVLRAVIDDGDADVSSKNL